MQALNSRRVWLDLGDFLVTTICLQQLILLITHTAEKVPHCYLPTLGLDSFSLCDPKTDLQFSGKFTIHLQRLSLCPNLF